MTTSDAGLTYIQSQEGYTSDAIFDVNGWAAGYGHHGPDVVEGTVCDTTQAVAWLQQDVATQEDELNNSGLAFTTQQFDALVDFGYNAGPARLQTVLDFLNNNDPQGAKSYLLSIVNAGGSPMQVLSNRRQYEAAQFDFDNWTLKKKQ